MSLNCSSSSDSNEKNVHKYRKKDLFPFLGMALKNNNKNSRQKNLDNNQNIFNSRNKISELNESNSSVTSHDLYNIEKQLESVNEKFEISYKQKLYENILKDIEGKEELLNIKSVESFNFYVMKIRCMIKRLKGRFEYILRSKLEPKNFFDIDSLIFSVKNEFQNLSLLFMRDNKYEYEKSTQIYCKFLLVLSTIGYHRDEYFQSMSYIILGIKMMKLFFIRQQIATDIKTYDVCIQLFIILINRLLEDNNFNEAIYYNTILFKILDISFKFMYKNKIDAKYQMKFSKYAGYNYTFTGYYYEQINDDYLAFECYKEACYFLNKSQKKNIFGFQNYKMCVDDECENVVNIVKDKLKAKIIFEEKERQRKYEQMEKRKKELQEEALRREKTYNLKLVASGFSAKSVDRFNNIKKMLYSEVLTPYNQRLIERYDTELISFVYNDKNKNKNKNKSINNKKSFKKNKTDNDFPSFDTKNNLCHYKIYSKLMTKEYKEFLLKNKVLEFYNPTNEKDILDKLQGYLNRKMEIDVNSSTTKKNTSKNNNILRKNNTTNSIQYTKTESNFSHKSKSFAFNNFKMMATENNSFDPTDDNEDNFKTKLNLRFSDRNNVKQQTNSQIILSKDLKNNNEKSTILPKIQSNKNSTKLRLRQGNLKENEYDKHKIDKYILSHNYLGKISYLDNLASKELDFQKTLLNIKNTNCKLYFNGYKKELRGGGRISKDDVYKAFIRIEDKATDVEHNYELEVQRDKEIRNQPKVIGQIFKTVGNMTGQGKEAKSFTNKVINRYIQESKKKKLKMSLDNKSMENDYVKKSNEDALMKLNNSIKELNFLLKVKKDESNNKNSKKY